MYPLDLVRLTPLMKQTRGSPWVKIGLIDGPVAVDHPDLAAKHIRLIPGKLDGACTLTNSLACHHGTFVAGVLCANPDSVAPSICPGCTLLVSPIFKESGSLVTGMPATTPRMLCQSIIACVEAGALLINLSAALIKNSTSGDRELDEVLDYTARRNVIVVAAAGNQGTIGSSAITRHPWVIPVTACDNIGRPLNLSTMGNAIGRWGLMAPGDKITGISPGQESCTLQGTSVAAPFVTGSLALIWSLFPDATAGEIKYSLLRAPFQRRNTIVPPLLDAWAGYQAAALLGKPASQIA